MFRVRFLALFCAFSCRLRRRHPSSPRPGADHARRRRDHRRPDFQIREKVGSAVTVISREQIEASRAENVAELLETVPGLNVNQSGGVGGTSNIYIRGADPDHTQVLIDGVRVNDPAQASGEFDFLAVHARQYRTHRGSARSAIRSLWQRRDRRRHQYRDPQGRGAAAGHDGSRRRQLQHPCGARRGFGIEERRCGFGGGEQFPYFRFFALNTRNGGRLDRKTIGQSAHGHGFHAECGHHRRAGPLPRRCRDGYEPSARRKRQGGKVPLHSGGHRTARSVGRPGEQQADAVRQQDGAQFLRGRCQRPQRLAAADGPVRRRPRRHRGAIGHYRPHRRPADRWRARRARNGRADHRDAGGPEPCLSGRGADERRLRALSVQPHRDAHTYGSGADGGFRLRRDRGDLPFHGMRSASRRRTRSFAAASARAQKRRHYRSAS